MPHWFTIYKQIEYQLAQEKACLKPQCSTVLREKYTINPYAGSDPSKIFHRRQQNVTVAVINIKQGKIDNKADCTPKEIRDNIIPEPSCDKLSKPSISPLLPIEQEA